MGNVTTERVSWEQLAILQNQNAELAEEIGRTSDDLGHQAAAREISRNCRHMSGKALGLG